jgi:SAM-dependent methyltransferase
MGDFMGALAQSSTCRCCGASDLFPLIDFGPLPIAHRLLSDPAEVESTHQLALDCCAHCGFIQVTSFIDPELLYLDYNYCFSAWKPQPHTVDELELIQRVASAQSVFEIGANDGMFLSQLSMAGLSSVAGVEPNPFARQEAEKQGLRVLPGMFDDAVAQAAVDAFGRFDLVVARQVLEHIPDLNAFFGAVERLLSKDGFVLLELPDFEWGLEAGDCSTIWEEHVNYFTEPTLTNLLGRFGYEVIAVRRYNFSGGAITMLARKTLRNRQPPHVPSVVSLARAYQSKVDRYRVRLRRSLEECRRKGERVVLYGVGCRGCIVVNGLGIGDLIDFAIDDQVERVGKFMPGSRLPIHLPNVLADTSGGSVVLLAVNQENEAKVKGRLKSGIQTASVVGPNDLWSELDALDGGRTVLQPAGASPT